MCIYKIVGKMIDVLFTKNVLRYTIGYGSYIYGSIGMIFKKPSTTKYKWLGHYLIGDGSPLIMPKWMIEQDTTVFDSSCVKDKEICEMCGDNLYRCVGRFKITYDNDHKVLHSIDKYDWHSSQLNKKALVEDYSIEFPIKNTIIRRILCTLYSYSQVLQDIMIYHDYVQTYYDFVEYLRISDSFWEYLGGTPFFTILFYQYKEK